jgi:methyl coenzyme M reductase gamma subunit
VPTVFSGFGVSGATHYNLPQQNYGYAKSIVIGFRNPDAEGISAGKLFEMRRPALQYRL